MNPDVEPLPHGFYARGVVEVARDLVGCVLQHGATAGVIVETEAYHETEPACHAHAGIKPRTSILFGAPGTAYVYRSYGIHALINAVCEEPGIGAAVLIRALEPLTGLELMRERRRLAAERALCSGPGKLTVALGIGLELNGSDLVSGAVRITARPESWREVELDEDTRIGITKATELTWRFLARDNRFVSQPLRRAAGAG